MPTSHGPQNIFKYQRKVSSGDSSRGAQYEEAEVKLNPPCEFVLPDDVTLEQLGQSKAFGEWLLRLQKNLKLQENEHHKFHAARFKLKKVEVQTVDYWQGRIGFIKLTSEIANDNGEFLPGAVFLRGGSVAILMIIQGVDEEGNLTDKHAIVTVQPRIAACSLAFSEIPAGMLDDGTVTGKAIAEIKEETDIEVHKDELVNMTELAANDLAQSNWRISGSKDSADDAFEDLSLAMYPSPGGCDEFMPLVLYQKRIPMKEFKAINGKLTGLKNEGEKITLKLVLLDDLWKECARDGKSLAALCLYERLGREGKLPDMANGRGV